METNTLKKLRKGDNMRVLIIASGGGHTGYGVAVAQHLHRKVDEITAVIPKNDEWSRELIKPYVDRVIEVPKPRLPGEGLYRVFTGLPRAVLESIWKIGKYDVVVATGSNHSLAPAVVAKLRGARLVAIESHDRFLSKGKTVSLLEKLGAIVAIHWGVQKDLYPNGIVGEPIVRKPKYSPMDKGYILVVGGFMGHKRLFDTFLELEYRNVVMQTGRIDPEKYRKPGWRVFRFDKDLDWWIAHASVVVGHNSTTILEAAVAYRKSIVIVPNPEWKDSASPAEAEILAYILGGRYVYELTPGTLAHAIEKARRYKNPPAFRFRSGAEILAEKILEMERR